MNKHALLFYMAISALAPSCQHHHTHKDDNYSERQKAGWRRSIGTDHVAGNNEYLYLDEFPMEWSVSENGSGFLYATKPNSNDLIWSFERGPDADQRAIKVNDGAGVIATHKTGVSYEIMIVLQTEYYGKVFYRKLDRPLRSKDEP